MLHLHHSNQLELLADQLADTLRRPLVDTLASETIVVQHPGMGRWLSLQLARRLSICANMAFPLPAGFIWQLLRQLLEDVPEADSFKPELMQWWLFERLVQPMPEHGFEPLRRYLARDDEVTRFQLAGEIANCFDQYLVYRPDWIEHWQQGRDAIAGDYWQAVLWRELVADRDAEHWVDLQQRLLRAVDAGQINPDQLPERICLFALNSLSPGYLEILNLSARWIEIHLFILNPAEGYWMDLVSEEELGRRTLDAADRALYLEVGNPLLASMGGQGSDFLVSLLSHDSGATEAFVEPPGDGLLHQLQRDILHACEMEERQDVARLDPGDRSLQFHLCHSPMREVQVLHDQLLARFAADESLQPSDILVMTPDMDSYAPYIEAVFGESAGRTHIPYTLSDRSRITETPIVSLFLQLLALPGGRYPVDEIFSLLGQPLLHRRFGLSAGDLPRIRHWLEAVAIRWGRDGSERLALGLPLTGQNSWQQGLDRLLLGYALPGNDEQLFQGLLPCAEVEGADAQILAGLYSFVTALFELERVLTEPAPLAVWASRLNDLIDRFFDPDEAESRLVQSLRSSIARIAETAALAGFAGKISRELMIGQLQDQFASPSGGRFLGGGVSFCALTPMRALPFRVICMIGMNDGIFPRERRPVGFNLLAGQRRPGDRSRRADDRYLFLETLISARDQLYFSYVGQDIRDNSSLPPSVLLSEVIDYLDDHYRTEQGGLPSVQLTVRHPLQAFNPRYFSPDTVLFSYADVNCQGAKALLAQVTPPVRFIQQPLTEPEDHWRQVELIQLIRFYTNPVRYLLSARLGITIAYEQAGMESRDPFELDYFQRSELFRRLVQASMEGGDPGQRLLVERARGTLPHGTSGLVLFERLADSARLFADRLQPLYPATETQTLTVDFTHGSLRLMGRLEGVSQAGLLDYSLEKIPDPQLLALWIRHLLLNVADADAVRPVTRWLSREGLVTLHPVADAAERLGDLLDLYWQGLRWPLPLFARSARSYATALQEGKPRELCLQRARQKWFGGYQGFAEYDNPYYRLAFPDGEVLDETFENLSERVFAPLLSAMEVS
ncbi:exodeoxyribonuclease V subunit gamma [Sedimenticola selenatireducens]|uniref:RecBCD enzyme subunit RecC n=1 Tax=Sedimenticola selenatireducens TaxID=191960 RepID=A0A2N6D1S7_9GAMM|nr:exodeoxyribonuclease V subunit gamma [Sedimenticola selenatireducens]PLX63633.1 MAG: exodeoxyribonuclease V subunit gamma [Sedimenticola selenatireducens]